MPFTGPLQIELQDVRKTSTNKNHALGQVAFTKDGRQFRYGLAGAVALTAGQLVQIPAVVANHQAVAVFAAAASGTKKVTVTLGATAATQDQYADGFLIVRDTSAAGAGQAFPVVGNSVGASSGTCDVYLDESIQKALSTSSVANLEQSPFGGVLVSTTADTTERVVGVPQVDVPVANYGWFQTQGVAAVLGNGAITKGSGVIKSATTAGAVDIEGASTITQRVGMALQTGTTAKYNTTYLTIV